MAVSGVVFFRKYDIREIVLIYFHDLLIALHLFKSFPRSAKCVFNHNQSGILNVSITGYYKIG